MKFNHKLLKELGIGVVSLTLVAPLVIGGMQSNSVHADYQSHDATARYFDKAGATESKSAIRQREREISAGDASEQRYEQNLIKRDPSAAGMYADEPDNDAKTKDIIREAVIKYPQDQDEAMLKRYHVKYHRNRARKRVTRRRNRHSSHRNRVRKHARKNKYGDDNMTDLWNQAMSDNKHDKQYQRAEHHETANYNHGVIEDMKSDPGLVSNVLYDAYGNHEHVNKTVLAKAKYWEHKDKANGSWYSPNGEPNKYYAWGRNLKRGRRHHAKRHAVRKHVARKHSNRRHHAKKNVKRSRHNKRGVKK